MHACVESQVSAAFIIKEDCNRTGGINFKVASFFSLGGGSATLSALDGPAQFEAGGNITTSSSPLRDGAVFLNLGNYVINTKGSATGILDHQITIRDINDNSTDNFSNWMSLGFSTENTPSSDLKFTNSETNNHVTRVATEIVCRNGQFPYLAGPDTNAMHTDTDTPYVQSNPTHTNLKLSKYSRTSNCGTVRVSSLEAQQNGNQPF